MIKIIVAFTLVASVISLPHRYGSATHKPKGSTTSINRKAPSAGVQYEKAYFTEDGEGGSHFRRGVRHEDGRIQGSYGLSTPDGSQRIVYYEADENGARYLIESNVPGFSNVETGDGYYGAVTGNREVYDRDAEFVSLFAKATGGRLSGTYQATTPLAYPRTVRVPIHDPYYN